MGGLYSLAMALERTLAPDITESAIGQTVVQTMADGIERLMLERGIPFTDEGFDTVVRLSRESGMLGFIAYQEGDLVARLRGEIAKTFGPMAGGVMENLLSATPAVDVRRRLARIGVSVDAHGKMSDLGEEFFGRMVEPTFGPQARTMLMPFVHGDCQRRLVFDELRRRHPPQGAGKAAANE